MKKYEVVTDFQRPSADLIERARDLYCCIVGGRVGSRFVMDSAIKPLQRDWRICGPALTVRPEQTDDLMMAQAAGRYVKPGDVVVIDAGGQTQSACLGASMVHGFKEKGACGIVADGVVLTGEAIRTREGTPVFCRGTVAYSNGLEHPGWINTPVICGGVIVNPGDLILGDEDGVVVVPYDRAEDIIDLVAGHGNEREGAQRPPGGVLPPRPQLDEPYHTRSGADQKLASREDVQFTDWSAT